jgi:hypothetical protein
MGVYSGKRGAVYISTSGSGEASPVIKLTNWTLDMTTDKLDVTSFQDGNKTYVQSWKDSKGTFKGHWDDTEDKMWDGADSADGVKVYLYPSTDAVTKYFYGPAWLDVSMEVDVNGTVSISGNFSANGTWGQMM